MTVVYSHGGKHNRVMPEGYQPAAGEIVMPGHVAPEEVKKAYKQAGQPHFEDENFVGGDDYVAGMANLEHLPSEQSKAEKKEAKTHKAAGVEDAEPVIVTTNAEPSDLPSLDAEDPKITAKHEKALHKGDHNK